MPLVTITLRPHSAQRDLAAAVADAVAESLGLGDGDVIAVIVGATDGVLSGGADLGDDWPLVGIHGSDRGPDAVTAARSAAERAVRDWGHRNGIEYEGVWTEWVAPTP